MKPIQSVVKRDGSIVSYEKEKITNAILKAAQATDSGYDRQWAENLAQRVEAYIVHDFGGDGRHPHVEAIQDYVERVFIEDGQNRIAKAYVLYREQCPQSRDAGSLLLDGLKLVGDYLERSHWRVNENANMNYSLQGLNFHVASSIAARYWLHKIYPPEVQQAHVEGALQVHDLGVLAAYCCGWDLQDLLLQGFGGVSFKTESKPPKHLRSALGQAINFLYTLQGETAGAQAFSSFDTLLAPFVRFDGLSYEEVKQAIQEFVFNVNVPTRVGFQTPFTNLTMDLVPPATLQDMPVIVGGEFQGETYGDFQLEMDMINRAFAEIMLEGDAKGRVFTFPIPTYNIHKEFDWDDPTLRPVWEMTARYGIPYFANFVNSDMKPEDARSMCCRLRLDNRILRRRGGGLFAANPLTGSVGVVTLNMSRLGYLAEDEDHFWELLESAMRLAQTSLEIKRRVLEQFMEDGLYPYSKHYLASVSQRAGSYWANHFSTIASNGMNECCLNFLGVDIAHEAGKEFAERVLLFMREKVLEFQIETDNLYNLEASPAESASYRLAKEDKARFPDIRTSGSEQVPYYTNSTHLPANHTFDLFEALAHQESLQVLYTGGTVFHAFLGEQINDWRQVCLLVRRIAESFRLPYFTLTTTFSICPVHGYLPGEHTYCPYKHTEDELTRFGLTI